MRLLGIFAFVAGVIWILFAFTIDTTVTSSNGPVHNIGLLEMRRSHLMIGALTTVVGVIFAVLGKRTGPEQDDSSICDTKRAEIEDLRALVASKGKTGLIIDTTDGRTVIRARPGSAADLAGIRPGDRLITIDGRLCDGDYRKTVLNLAGEPGTTARVSVRRDSLALEFDLQRCKAMGDN